MSSSKVIQGLGDMECIKQLVPFILECKKHTYLNRVFKIKKFYYKYNNITKYTKVALLKSSAILAHVPLCF